MAQVIVSIDGKSFRMACEDGQEPHLQGLAAHLNGKIADMRQSFGEIGDLRLTVMAALVVCDELFEERARLTRIQEAQAATMASGAAFEHSQATRDTAIATAIDSMTGRIERITRLLAGERGG
jgi:cell division protein ZapA